jgi:hypothetical protein
MVTVYEKSKDVSEKEKNARETQVNIVIYRWVSREGFSKGQRFLVVFLEKCCGL